ncbi:MAG: potB [Enterovirga sp.]|jgi:spermidine/putrescine transport system permease protein|nr:potB [Enterovirga sp.]
MMSSASVEQRIPASSARQERRAGLNLALIAGPYGLFLLAILGAPVFILVAISFSKHAPPAMWSSILSLENYQRATEPFYLEMFVRTLRIAILSTVASVIVGYPLAYFLARSPRNVATIGMFLLVTPLMVSTVIRSFGWIIILGRNGLISQAAQALGFEGPVRLLYTEFAVTLALTQIFLPLMVLPLVAAIERIPVRVEEAAASLGSSPLSVFLQVIVPLSRAGLVSGCLLCFTTGISVVVTPALLGGRSVRMAGNFVYEQVVTAFDWPLAASLANVLAILALLSTAAALGLSPKTSSGRS